jgi:hypothetical protein
MTSIITKDIQDIMFDLKQAQCNLEQYITDVDRGINMTTVGQAESEPKQHIIERLFYYLIEAKNDMDRIKDSLKEIHAKLDDLVDVVEYETLAEKVR